MFEKAQEYYLKEIVRGDDWWINLNSTSIENC